MSGCRFLALFAVAAIGVAGCGAEPGATPTSKSGFVTPIVRERPNLGYSNGTPLHLELYVNGGLIAEVAPLSGTPRMDASILPPLPWDVEARSTSGRVLTSMDVQPGEVQTSLDAAGSLRATSGTFGRVDLSCGRLTIWAGDTPPSGPAPPPSPGQPGDCEP